MKKHAIPIFVISVLPNFGIKAIPSGSTEKQVGRGGMEREEEEKRLTVR